MWCVKEGGGGEREGERERGRERERGGGEPEITGDYGLSRSRKKTKEGIYKHKRRKDLNGIFIFLENIYWLIKSLFCWFPWFHYYLPKTIFNIPATIISSSWNVTALIATNDRYNSRQNLLYPNLTWLLNSNLSKLRLRLYGWIWSINYFNQIDAEFFLFFS